MNILEITIDKSEHYFIQNSKLALSMAMSRFSSGDYESISIHNIKATLTFTTTTPTFTFKKK